MTQKRFGVADLLLYAVLGVFAFLTIYPFWSLIVISFSESDAYYASQYHLIPNSFTLEAYNLTFENPQFLRSLLISIGVTSAGTFNSIFWTIIMGYFLSKKGVARALSSSPRLIICDEPVSALDVSVQAQVLNLLADLQKEMGLTYLFIAHDLSVVEYISDRILVMYLGHVVESAATAKIFNRPVHPYTEALLNAIPQRESGGHRRRIVLAGDIPSPVNPPPGCVFHTRCKYVQPRCQAEIPLLRPLANDPATEVTCHFAEELELQPFLRGER